MTHARTMMTSILVMLVCVACKELQPGTPLSKIPDGVELARSHMGCISYDRRTVAFVGQVEDSKSLYVNGKRHAAVETPRHLRFLGRSDRIFYWDRVGTSWHGVVDGKRGPAFEHLRYIYLDRPRDAVNEAAAYVGVRMEQQILVVEGKPDAPVDEVDHYGGQESADPKLGVIVPIRKGDAWHIRTQGGIGPAYEKIQTANPSPNGLRYAYIGKLAGTAGYELVVDGKARTKGALIVHAGFSPDGKSACAVVEREDSITFAWSSDLWIEGKSHPLGLQVGASSVAFGNGGNRVCTGKPAGAEDDETAPTLVYWNKRLFKYAPSVRIYDARITGDGAHAAWIAHDEATGVSEAFRDGKSMGKHTHVSGEPEEPAFMAFELSQNGDLAHFVWLQPKDDGSTAAIAYENGRPVLACSSIDRLQYFPNGQLAVFGEQQVDDDFDHGVVYFAGTTVKTGRVDDRSVYVDEDGALRVGVRTGRVFGDLTIRAPK